MAGLEERYQKAVAFVGAWDAGKTMPNNRKLLCYGFFKQAAVGDVTGNQPYAVQFEKRSKWDAWNAVKGMSKDEAMKNYIEELEKQIKEFDPQNPGFSESPFSTPALPSTSWHCLDLPSTPFGEQHHHASDVFDGGIGEPPTLAASTSRRELVKPAASASRQEAASSASGVELGLKIRFVMALLMLVGLLVYELASFEYKDWRDGGRQPSTNGFTGSALLWALSTLWSLSQTFHCGLHCFSSKFRGFTDAQRLKVVKYLIQITWGSVILVIYTTIQLYYDGIIPGDCTTAAATLELGEHACAATYAWPYSHMLTLVGAMYMWELLHEGAAIHNTLALHHLCIVFILHASVGYYGTREDITAMQMQAIGDMGFPQLVAAGLEQPVFTALLLHRFGANPATRTRAFKVAWISFAVAKALALVLSVVVIAVEWDMAPLGYSIGMVVLNITVAPTQIYSTIVLRKLAKRMEQKGADETAAAVLNPN